MLMIRFIAAFVLATSVAPALAATHKCTDGKTITYANMPCESIGLSAIGKVRNLVTIMPATPAAIQTDKAYSDDDQENFKHNIAEQVPDDESNTIAKSSSQLTR